VPIAKEHLKSGIANVVVPACIDERGSVGLSRSKALAPVGKNLGAERPLFADVPLNEPPAIREVAIARGDVNVLAYTAVGRPGSEIFCAQIGNFAQPRPTPNPFVGLPVGASNMVNVPIIGRHLFS